jgi:16S rRNA (uracil1498-N3)-methyltransferase
MARFHISPGSEKDGVVTLDKDESHHALSVLRLKAGEVVELLDGHGGVFQGIVAGTERGLLKISVRGASQPTVPSRALITLAVSVIKSESMEFLIQKSCELGANSIVPLISERTIVRLSRERWETKIQRWQKIAKESCKQCGQPSIPVIHPVAEFKKFTETISQYDFSLVPTLAVPPENFFRSLQANQSAKSVLILIGPEGDFSREEAQRAIARGAKPVNLGPRVLRSETAALFSLSVVNFFYQEGALTSR